MMISWSDFFNWFVDQFSYFSQELRCWDICFWQETWRRV